MATVKRRLLRVAFSAALAALLLLLLEGGASVLEARRAAARSVARMEENPYSVFDPRLGWRHRPGQRSPHLFGPGNVFTTNAQGFRGAREHAREEPPGRARVLCLGDSFTLGHGVGDGESWPARLEARCPAVESVNLGVGGYGLDQAWLLYRERGLALAHSLVLVGVIRDDLGRMGLERFWSQPKPVLALGPGGELRPANLPLARPARTAGESFLREWAKALALTRLVRAAREGGGRPEFVPDFEPADDAWAPLARAVLADLGGRARTGGPAAAVVYLPDLADLRTAGSGRLVAWLADAAWAAGLPLVDLTPRFREEPGGFEGLFLPDGHYAREGYDLVAREVARRLPDLLPGFAGCPPP